ncbi:hypothetical protein F5Y11DRAFT_353988 [Daldinia sp. FL1419]|nr:hypothetical protein F5Y11DRAFT_353988 [Daldinia sp. FL1419]
MFTERYRNEYTASGLLLQCLIRLSTWKGWSILEAIVISILTHILRFIEVKIEIAISQLDKKLDAARDHGAARATHTGWIEQEDTPPPYIPAYRYTVPLIQSAQEQPVDQIHDISSDQPEYNTPLPYEAPIVPIAHSHTSSPHRDDIHQDTIYSYQERQDNHIEPDQKDTIQKDSIQEHSESPESSRLPPQITIVLKLSSTRASRLHTQPISVSSASVQQKQAPTIKTRHLKKKKKKKRKKH